MNPILKYKLIHPIITLKSKWYKFYNIIMFRFLGVSLGNNSDMRNKIFLRIFPDASVKIGNNFTVASGDNLNPISSNKITSIAVENKASLAIGNYCGISGSTIWATTKIQIGNHVNIGANCSIIDGDMHSTDWKEREKNDINPKAVSNYKSQPIIIGNNVWIGENCIILKGVSIGDRSIIAAGSIVTKNIPADCVAGGNPCSFIKKI